MQYKRIDVLKGSIAIDREWLKRVTDLLAAKRLELFETMQETERLLDEDFLPRALALIEKIQGGEGIVYTSDIEELNYVKNSSGRRATSHGHARHHIDNLEREISKLEQQVEEWDFSSLTKFLSSIEDEFVTDSGVRTAGFEHGGLGVRVLKGREVENGNQSQNQD